MKQRRHAKRTVSEELNLDRYSKQKPHCSITLQWGFLMLKLKLLNLAIQLVCQLRQFASTGGSCFDC